ncbi:MAG: alcohol dehydrogenase catalytic domain-containing protein [Clostridiales bacterium]|nr:alcohol dehydrogenase catalytic domain-containing protein [Clostridiales bacterium]
MNGIVYKGINKVEYKTVEDPRIERDDDIIVRVTSTAICGSDLHLVHGLIPNLEKDSTLGHETMGIVEEAGRAVTAVKKGDRVIIPFPVACGHCQYCEQELYSQCENSNENGEIGGIIGYGDCFGGYDGGQAEDIRVPYANVGPVVDPEVLPDVQVLFLTAILTTSYWGVESACVKPGSTVAVLGCGPVGQLAQKWAAYLGAEMVYAVDCVDYRLEHAKKHNGVETIHLEAHDDTGAYLKEITHGGVDCVIDCVGLDGKMSALEKVETALKMQGASKSAIEIASKAVRRGGHVSLVGLYGAQYHHFPRGDFFSRNITLHMGQCPAHKYVRPILDLIQKGEFDPTDIITHKMKLSDGEQAYSMFDKREDNCIKVIMNP